MEGRLRAEARAHHSAPRSAQRERGASVMMWSAAAQLPTTANVGKRKNCDEGPALSDIAHPRPEAG
jgi:hypothetical protein